MKIQKPTITDFTFATHDHSNAAGGGTIANITGNAATVTTNANLTGVVTSVGNVTAFADGVTASSPFTFFV